jgi:hypothetical protein
MKIPAIFAISMKARTAMSLERANIHPPPLPRGQALLAASITGSACLFCLSAAVLKPDLSFGQLGLM